MEQADLIRESRNLLNLADEKRIAGDPNQANAHLGQLYDLLEDEVGHGAPAAPKETPAEQPAEH